MKKLLLVFTLFVAVMAVSLAADVAAPSRTEFGSVNVREGRNVVRLRDGSTLLFVARLGEISGVELRQPTGRVIKFEDDACPTCGNQQPVKPCNGELRCVFSEKHKATICFCVPKLDFSNGGGGETWAVDFFLDIDEIKGESKRE